AEQDAVRRQIAWTKPGLLRAHFAALVDEAGVPGRVSASAGKGWKHKSLAGVGRQLHRDAARLATPHRAAGKFEHRVERRAIVEDFARDGKPASLAHHAVETGGLAAVTEEHIELQGRTRGPHQAKT